MSDARKRNPKPSSTGQADSTNKDKARQGKFTNQFHAYSHVQKIKEAR